MTMIADSFCDDEPSCLEDLSPRDKVGYFVKGMKDNSVDLVTFRNDPELRSFVAEHEAEIWSIWGDIAAVITSIRAQHNVDAAKDEMAKRHHLQLVETV